MVFVVPSLMSESLKLLGLLFKAVEKSFIYVHYIHKVFCKKRLISVLTFRNEDSILIIQLQV